LEDWEDIYFAVLAELQDKTPRHEVTSRESMRRIVPNKLSILPYLVLMGLVGVVSAAVAFRRRKA
jgi:hypothetical protein